jgi:hypothetical protein
MLQQFKLYLKYIKHVPKVMESKPKQSHETYLVMAESQKDAVKVLNEWALTPFYACKHLQKVKKVYD